MEAHSARTHRVPETRGCLLACKGLSGLASLRSEVRLQMLGQINTVGICMSGPDTAYVIPQLVQYNIQVLSFSFGIAMSSSSLLLRLEPIPREKHST